MIAFVSPYSEGSVNALRREFPGLVGIDQRLVIDLIAKRRRALAGVFRRLGWVRTSTRLMYLDKVMYDCRVSHKLRKQSISIVIGMWGSSKSVFESLPSAVRVLNFVNAHPLDHNERLIAAGASNRDAEMVPQSFVQRINRELQLADIVVVPSVLVRDQLVRRDVALEKICVAPYGVDGTAFVPMSERERRDKSLGVLYVGQISKRKGVELLLNAFKALENEATLTIVGPIVDTQMLKSLHGAVYIPTVSHSELAKLYAANDVFVLPSWEDTFGLVVLEAMSAGLVPIVTSSAGASASIHR